MGLMSVMADIWRSRSRSALTMSAVAIGIFSVTVISAAGQIGTAKINDSLDDMGVNSVLVEAQEAGVALSDSDIDALGGLSGVNGAMLLMAQVTKCELIESNVSCMVWGVNEKADEIISMKAIHGRLIDRSDLKKAENICVIDDEIALETYGRTNIVGKTVSVNFGGKYTDFTVDAHKHCGHNRYGRNRKRNSCRERQCRGCGSQYSVKLFLDSVLYRI